MNIINNNIWILINNEWIKGIEKNNKIYIEEEVEEIDEEINIKDNKIELRNDDYNIDNLINLHHLNEPSILETLLYRYKKDNIYTLMGNILISINPYKNINIYNKEIVKKYDKKELNENIEPHIYSIIKNAYENLLKNSKNQSIIVSGVSGSGKTYNCKKIMRYLSIANEKEELINSIERKIIESNIILESFGNAKTISNNNSSRFGKYIKILFNKEKNLIAAEIEICLLEKTRVIYQEKGERNYHIFYEILKGIEEEKLKKYKLERDYKKYEYLKKSNCNERTDNINDKEEFIKLEKALEIFNIDKEEIYLLISSILHIGNIKIEKEEIKNEEEIKIISELLKIDEKKLKEILLFKKIRVEGEIIKKKLNVKESNEIRDTLAKIIYNRLFNSLVEKINKLIKKEKGEYFIGILDIFGFEVFNKNNFEQFNINYANEKLQQEFNNYVFKDEQKIYNKEKIDWSEIDFPNNDKCVELFESKIGFYKMLDDECLIPQGNEENLYNKLIKIYDKHEIVNFLKKDYINKKFIINHYVGKVSYDINNFCIKNKNILNIDLINLLLNSEILILKELEKEIKIKRTKIYSESISYKFINQLNNFINSIRKTKQHYIRCIKPNNNDLINTSIKSLILEQLRYCGILETVKISRAGYEIRLEFEKFIEKFKIIMDNKIKDNKKKCIEYLSKFEYIKEYQIGISKIFIKRSLFEKLEIERINKINISIIKIQTFYRCHNQRKKYNKIKKNIIKCQSYIRRYLSKKIYIKLKKEKSAIIIQKNMKMLLVRKKYLKIRNNIIKIQCKYRYLKLKERCRKRLEKRMIIIIQKNVKMLLERKKYLKIRNLIIKLQKNYRKNKEIKNNKEKETIKYIKNKNKILENKIIDYEEKLIKQNELNNELNKSLINKLNEEKEKIIEIKKEMEIKEKNIINKLNEEKEKMIKYKIEMDNMKKKIDEITHKKNEENEYIENIKLKLEYEKNLSNKIQNDNNNHILYIKKLLLESNNSEKVKLELAEKINKLLIENEKLNNKIQYNNNKSLINFIKNIFTT